jgi:hypothetical protein
MTKPLTRGCVLWGAVSLGVLSATTAAAQPATAAPEQTPPEVFVWRPSLALTDAGFDSNVLNEPRAAHGDFFATVAGGLAPVWRVGDGKLSADTSLSYNYFREYTRERGADAKLGARIEFPIASALVHVDGSYANVRQRLNFEIDERARRSQSDVRAGIDLALGDRTTAGMDVHQLDVSFADRSLNSLTLRDALNRTERGVAARLDYAVTPLTSLTLTGDLTDNQFRFSPTRDGQRTRVGGGVLFGPDALVTGKAAVSWQRVTIQNPGIESFRGGAADVGLSTKVGADTRLGFSVARDVQFSADDRSPYYVQNGVRASLGQGLGNRWDVGVRGERAALNYAQAREPIVPPDHERVAVVGATLGYHFAGGLRIGIDVEDMRRTSDSNANRSYTTRRIFTSFSRPIGF